MSTTTISNITITPKPKGTLPCEVDVTVTADVANRDGQTPQAYFPAQSMGTPMENTTGNTWSAQNMEMYDGSEKTIKITCNGVEQSQSFKP